MLYRLFPTVSILVAFCLTSGLSAQQTTKADNGREVLLRPDGTWEYQDDVAARFSDIPQDKVTWVFEADVIELYDFGEVKLVGVIAPKEKETRDFARDSLTGQTVWVAQEGERKDRAGRPLVYIYLTDARMFNAELVKYGYARVDEDLLGSFTYVNKFLEYEQLARAENRGLWEGGNSFAGKEVHVAAKTKRVANTTPRTRPAPDQQASPVETAPPVRVSSSQSVEQETPPESDQIEVGLYLLMIKRVYVVPNDDPKETKEIYEILPRELGWQIVYNRNEADAVWSFTQGNVPSGTFTAHYPGFLGSVYSSSATQYGWAKRVDLLTPAGHPIWYYYQPGTSFRWMTSKVTGSAVESLRKTIDNLKKDPTVQYRLRDSAKRMSSRAQNFNPHGLRLELPEKEIRKNKFSDAYLIADYTQERLRVEIVNTTPDMAILRLDEHSASRSDMIVVETSGGSNNRAKFQVAGTGKEGRYFLTTQAAQVLP